MHKLCIVSYVIMVQSIHKSKNTSKKGANFILWKNGITSLKTHIDVDHATIAKRLKKEVNNLTQWKKEIQLATKKRTKCVWGIYPKNIIVKDSFKKDEV